MIKEKSFYKSVLTIAIPIALQNLISFATSMMDTIMLGVAQDGETLLSAASLANQPFFLLSMLCFGLASGASVLAAQYWGKNDIASIRRIFSIAVKLAFVMSLILGLTVLIFPRQVLSLYSDNEAIIEQGVYYLQIIGYAYFTFGLSSTAICLLRSVELVRISVLVNIVSFVTNVFLNWVLIYGKLGFEPMGIRGAAVGTLVARLSEFVITMIYVFHTDSRLGFRFRHLLGFSKPLFKDMLKFGSPVFINESLWALGITVQASIIGHITYADGDPVAANSLASMIQQLALIVVFGIANAAAVVIGKTIGEGDAQKARKQADTFRILGYLVGVLAFLTLFLLKDVAVGFYNIPDDSKALASQLITVVAFITLFIGSSGMGIVGILRGGGDTRFCLLAEMITLWCVAVPLAWLGANVWYLPVPVVLLLMKLDEPIKAIVCVIREKSGRWLRKVTRDTAGNIKEENAI